MTEDDRALRARAEAACAKADPDWSTMFSGEQEARIASWLDGYRTATQEHFDYSAGMNAMLRINSKLLVSNAALRQDASKWRARQAELLAARVVTRDSPDSPVSTS